MRADDAGELRRGVTCAELRDMTFPPIRWIVEGYIAEGLTILAGKPKLGKSWLCLDIALAVASGGVALGARRCERGRVLYAALEDPRRRLKGRVEMVLGDCQSWPEGLTFWSYGEMSPVDGGGLGQLREWIDENPGARLVIIDTFAKVRGVPQRGEPPYQADYREVGVLKALADETGVSIVVVTHTRKLEADDPFDTVSGTHGITGAADTTVILARDGQGVTLHAMGRDVVEIATAVEFEKRLSRWRELGDAATVRRSDERSSILKALGEADEPMSPRDLAAEIGKPNTAVRKMLGKMVKSGEIVKALRGRYSLPAQSLGHNAHNGHNGTVVVRADCDPVTTVSTPLDGADN